MWKEPEITAQKYLDDDELCELRRILDKFREKDLRNTVLIELALETAARASELLGILAGDIDHKTKSLYLRALKKGKNRTYPLSREMYKRLKELSKDLRPEDRVFPVTYQRLHQIWMEYRPVKKKFHALRHTRAIEVYKKTKDIKIVQRILGHRNLDMANVYLDFVHSDAELRKALY